MRYDNLSTIGQFIYPIMICSYGCAGVAMGSNLNKQNALKNGVIGGFIGIGTGLIAPISIPLLMLGFRSNILNEFHSDVLHKYHSDILNKCCSDNDE